MKSKVKISEREWKEFKECMQFNKNTELEFYNEDNQVIGK
jgi:hypothetical protein